MVYYWIAVVVAKLVGNKNSDAEEIKMNKNLNVLRDLTISLSLAMTIVYLAVCGLTMVTTPELAAETLGDTNFIIFSITYGVQFAVSIYVIQAGVRMVVAELVPAFKGIADKFIPNAVPALDIPIIYPYQPNSVLIGFLSATVGAIGAFFLQVALAGTSFELPLILPTLFTSFFYGAVSNNTKYLFLKFTVGYYTDCFKKSQGFFQYLQCESGNKVYLYKYGIPGISG